MKKLVSEWLIQLIWFLAGIFATGAFWYFLSKNELISTLLSGIAAFAFAAIAAYLSRFNDRSSRFKIVRDEITKFIKEAHYLTSRKNELPLPINDLNNWVNRVNNYLTTELDDSFAVRFNDLTGFVFYGDGSDKSNFCNSVDGRIRRLNQFLTELL